ncbi:PTS system IIA component, L-Asc family [Seinonella peptonophila]|uniref:PTS system IIA component, L-Asc family n=1 Tax=Seinonella peptonophila TaxID=112248 RepID=A0A1M4SWX8_9BACL|nr:PTS sugar transporter subunit IIA [Seinonella peptonophila]SHE36695.1 PTS system IIA component, L-Asc family [Seinonella peptonophila]
MNFLDRERIQLDVSVDTPEAAIREAGKLLVKNGDVEEGYVEKMVEAFRQHGPYFVIAPQIALPHARPEDGVNQAALSLIRLEKPLSFGHQTNDPVELVFALAASSSNEHLEVLQRISKLLGNKQTIQQLLMTGSVDEIEIIIKELST